jgi:hypothetical protein
LRAWLRGRADVAAQRKGEKWVSRINALTENGPSSIRGGGDHLITVNIVPPLLDQDGEANDKIGSSKNIVEE